KRIRVHLKKNGQRIIVETTAHEIDYNSRKARLVVSYDITERLETERQKEFDRNNLAALINNTDDLMWSVDNDLRLITCNDSFSRTIERACGRPLTKGDRILSLPFPKEQTTRYQGFYDRALSGESFTIIERFDSPFQFWSEISFYPIGRAGSVIGTACFSRDITERRKAEEEMRLMEKELLDQKVEEQKKVTRAIIKGQEKERDHIGQELHDNVNQILVGTKMYLNMAGGKNEELKEMIRYPLELIDASIQEIRVLTSRYVTPMKDIDLQELLQGLMDKLKDASSVAIEFDYFVTSDIEDELKLNIYRIIQEQINNVVKHAEATHLNVTVKGDCNFIDIAVADDGKGFDPATKRKGIGISNMTNRVESFNGEIHIESAPGKGCRTSIRIPH
ncbi:MAG TPA: ATP-binding protein, partial [Chitinophagaceae bacterium]|nr:ATP-binding protein [Chitinophagaceae bacterium]